MRVTVVPEQSNFVRSPDGAVWTQVTLPYARWRRYLEVFDEVNVVSRVQDVDAPPETWLRADGPGVRFTTVPFWSGPAQYVARLAQIRRAAFGAVREDDAVILRLLSQVSDLLHPQLTAAGHPFAAVVPGDPWDVFRKESVRHPLRPFFRVYFTYLMRRQCASASVGAYVTRWTLQRRYPCPGPTFGVSDVDITPEALVEQPRRHAARSGPHHLLLVGTLAQLYKGVDVLIDAMARCAQRGIELTLTVVGDGRYRETFAQQAERLGLGGKVTFRGQITAGAPVRAELDKADLFVLPSRAEGLPRALIEAMARALPCVGTTVGGIPELLAQEDMVPPGDAAALAKKLSEVVRSPSRLDAMSARALAMAELYREERLNRERLRFYSTVRDVTQEWLLSGKRRRR